MTCAPSDFERVRAAFEAGALRPEVADITMKPLNEVQLAGEEGQKMKRLLEALEDLDDVQHVYTSASIDE